MKSLHAKTFARRVAAWVVALSTLVGVSLPVHARSVPWPGAPISIHAQEQPLPEFLQDVFGAAGLRVLSAPSLQGRVSGHFDAPPAEIFSHVIKAYGLLPYYDGTVMHVASATSIVDRSVKLDSRDLNRVVHALVAQQLADEHQTVTVLRDQGLIKIRGAAAFVSDVEELIRHTRTPTRVPTRTPTAVAPLPIADQPASRDVVFRSFRLRYASAADLTFIQNQREVRVPGVASLLRGMMGAGGASLARPPAAPQLAGNSVPSVRGQGLQNQGLRQRPNVPVAATQVAPDNSGDGVTRIEADTTLNAIIVRDYADAMPLYQGLIEELDVEPLLVEIKVTIVDVDRGKLRDVGVDWRYSDRRNDIQFGGGVSPDQDSGLVLNTVLGDSGSFLARIGALAQDGEARLVSRPQVLTLNNLEAVLTTDQSFFVRVAGNEDVDLFNVSVGTALRVVPNVVGDPADPQIRLLVTIEDGSLNPDLSVDEIPVVERSSLNTQAIIFDGESLLLGGLVSEATSTNSSGVPVLGSLPGVGRLFRRDEKVERAQERLFMITPSIVVNVRSGASRPARAPARASTQPPQVYLDGF